MYMLIIAVRSLKTRQYQATHGVECDIVDEDAVVAAAVVACTATSFVCVDSLITRSLLSRYWPSRC